MFPRSRFMIVAVFCPVLASWFVNTPDVSALQQEGLQNQTADIADELPAITFSGNFFSEGMFPRDPQSDGKRWQLETRLPRSFISAMTWHPQGNLLAVGEFGGAVRIYRTDSWELVNLLYCGGAVSAVQYSPDGKWLATTSSNNPEVNSVTTLKIWKADGTAIAENSISFGLVSNIAWSPDSLKIATAGYYRKVLVFDILGKQKLEMEGHRDTIRHIAWNSLGTQVASASRDGLLRIWDLSRAIPKRDRGGDKPRPRGPDDEPDLFVPSTSFVFEAQLAGLVWMPDGKTLVCAEHAGRVYLREADGKIEEIFKHENGLDCFSLQTDGKQLAATSKKTVVLFDIAKKTSRVLKSGEYAQRVQWDPQQDRLALTTGNSVIVLETDTGKQRILAGRRAETIERPIEWGPDGKVFTCQTRDGWLRFWNADGDGVTRRWRVAEKPIWDVSWSSNNHWLTTFAFGDKIRFWKPDGEKGPDFEDLRGYHKPAWSPNGKTLATVGIDGSFRFADDQGKIFSRHQEEIQRHIFQWSPHSDLLAIAGANHQVKIKLLKTDGNLVKTMTGDVTNITALAWHPMANRLAMIDRQGNVRDWTADGKPGPIVGKHEKAGAAVAWSPDGQWLASSSNDIQIWNSEDELQTTIQQPVNALLDRMAWHPDSTWLAAQIYTKAIQLWKPTGEKGPTLFGNALAWRSMAWSPNGELIACSTSDDCVIAWDAATGETLWIGIELPNGKSAAIDASGNLITNDKAAFDQNYVFVAYVDGKNTLKTAAEFAEAETQKQNDN